MLHHWVQTRLFFIFEPIDVRGWRIAKVNELRLTAKSINDGHRIDLLESQSPRKPNHLRKQLLAAPNLQHRRESTLQHESSSLQTTKSRGLPHTWVLQGFTGARIYRWQGGEEQSHSRHRPPSSHLAPTRD